MTQRQRRQTGRKTTRRQAPQEEPSSPVDPAQHHAAMEAALGLIEDQVLPALEDFRAFMLEQNRRLEVTNYLDHIEGPQVVVQISRPDGKITATFIAEVTADGIRPYWDATSTGRFKTRWTEIVPGGAQGVTREGTLEKLQEFYNTDFS